MTTPFPTRPEDEDRHRPQSHAHYAARPGYEDGVYEADLVSEGQGPTHDWALEETLRQLAGSYQRSTARPGHNQHFNPPPVPPAASPIPTPRRFHPGSPGRTAPHHGNSPHDLPGGYHDEITPPFPNSYPRKIRHRFYVEIAETDDGFYEFRFHLTRRGIVFFLVFFTLVGLALSQIPGLLELIIR